MTGTGEKSPVSDVEDLAYEVVNKIARGTEVLLARLESVGSIFEQKEAPVYNVVVNTPTGDPIDVQRAIKKATDAARYGYQSKRAVVPVVQDGTPLSREQLLRELYRYTVEHTDIYLPWEKKYEDQYATASGLSLTSLLKDAKTALEKSEQA